MSGKMGRSTSVAGSRLDDSAARQQVSFALGFFHHAFSNSILNAAAFKEIAGENEAHSLLDYVNNAA